MKHFVLAIFGLFLFANFCSPVFSQVQTWNTKAREKAQNLNSAAVTALSRGQQAFAVNLLNQATVTCPSDPIPFSTLGIALAKEGKYAAALDALGKSYDLKHNAETLLTTGFVYYLEHDYEAAIRSWTKALEQEPRTKEIYGDLGYAYLRKGDFQKAEECFHNLAKLCPSSQLAFQGMALLKYLEGDLSASRQAAEHAQSISSYHPALLLLAKVCFLQGDKPAAEQAIRSWLVARRKTAPVRSMTTLGYPIQRDFHWDPLLGDNFDNGNLLLARTRLLPNEQSQRKSLLSKGRIKEALPLAEQTHLSAPDDFYVLRELALLKMANAEFSRSADDFLRVLKLCPDCNVDWLHVGRAQFLAGKKQEAASAVQVYLRKFPGQKLSPAFTALVDQSAGATAPSGDTKLDSVEPANKEQKSGAEGGF